MNAGAFGGEMSNIIKSVEYLNTNGDICEVDNKDMKFSYRRSIFNNGEWIGIITRCKISLIKSDKKEILDKMSDYLKSRKEKQPLEFPSAGSVFKRPEGYYTGKLIGDLGLKGFSIGGAQISEKHAGFIINKNNATAKDVKELIAYIKEKVKETYNVELETEIKML
jgi:UDP-N-acetylmuramate dehydrogenase